MGTIIAIDLGAAGSSDTVKIGEARNRAAAAAHTATGALARHGDEVLAEDRAAIETAISQLREINDGDDYEAINARSVALIQAASTLGEDLFEAKPVERKPGSASKS